MSEKFPVGTVVCLKSGGPAMTVEPSNGYEGWSDVCCVWFNGETLEHARICEACLEPAVLIDCDDDQEERVLSS